MAIAACAAAGADPAHPLVTHGPEGIAPYPPPSGHLHDGEDKSTTAEAIGPLIEALQKMDAKILPIDENTKVIQYIKADSVE